MTDSRISDEEFALECIRRLTPDTRWHGSHEDSNSIDNLDVLYDMICILLDELTNDAIVPEGNLGCSSFICISNKKQKLLRYVRDYIDDYIEKENDD